MGGNGLQQKRFARLFFMLLLLVSLVFSGCQAKSTEETAGGSQTENQETVSSKSGKENESGSELSDEKPEVAEIEPNNKPNRIITTFHGDTKTKMGFNWYTTDRFD